MNYHGNAEFGTLHSVYQMAAHGEVIILVQKDLAFKKKTLTIEGVLFDVHNKTTKDFKVQILQVQG